MMKELCVPAKLEQLDPVLAFVSNELENAGCDAAVQTQIMIAVEEIFVNIFSYAYPPKEGMATIRMQIEGTPAVAQIEMIDQGYRMTRCSARIRISHYPRRSAASADWEFSWSSRQWMKFLIAMRTTAIF